MTSWNVISVRIPGTLSSGGASTSRREPRVRDPAAAHDRVRGDPGLGQQLAGVAQREPAQVRGVEDALGLARPGPAREVRVGAPVGDVRAGSRPRSRPARAAARSGAARPTGRCRCSRMSAAIRASKRPSGAAVSTSPVITWSSRVAGLAGVLGLELDADHLDLLALLERGARRPRRAAEIEHPPGRLRHVLEDLRPGALVGRCASRALSGMHRAADYVLNDL